MGLKEINNKHNFFTHHAGFVTLHIHPPYELKKE
jgi:hypothetical protein